MKVSTVKPQKFRMFVDYIPAELRKGIDWVIVYYAKNPTTNKLERYRVRVLKLKNATERLKHAKRVVAEINSKLEQGWSPFYNDAGKTFKSWSESLELFSGYILKQQKNDVFRADTLRTYKSNLNLLCQFIAEKKLNITFAIQFDKSVCVRYLDWIYLERNSSPRTRNNHLIFLRLFSNYLYSRGILPNNPTDGIQNIKKTAKRRAILPDNVKAIIKEEIMSYNDGFYCLCMATYYCFIRNTELRKLKVSDINLDEKTIRLRAEISKNKKDETITIPKAFLHTLAIHINGANPTDYVFGAKQFYPSPKEMAVRTINNKWDAVRSKLELNSEYQFYSLKDTGITDLFLAGIPAIKIRDQARHSDIKITELYAIRKNVCDETINLVENEF